MLDAAILDRPVAPVAPVIPGLSTVSRVYCGRCIPGGGVVSDADLERFLQTVVAEHFPDGFTVLSGQGGWRDHASGQTITENSVVFEFFHSTPQLVDVHAVGQAWKRWFRQDAVGLTSTPVSVSFI